MKHCLSVIGLIMNGMGGILLFLCPPPKPPPELTEDGVEKHPRTFVREFVRPGGSIRGRFRYLWRLYGFRTGAALLVVGFAVQVIAELVN